MSDRTIITEALERIERRIRINGQLKDFAFGFSISLVFPLLFKVWDLFLPLAASSVRLVLAVWLGSLGVYLAWKLFHRKGTLMQAASSVDAKARLHDELKTAYWFISHGISSPWVDLQIRRASKTAQALHLERLYPWVIPHSSYVAATLFLLLVILNFAPLPWTPNWAYSKARAALALSNEVQTLFKEVQKLLRKAEGLGDAKIAGRIQEILKGLQEGKISAADALQQLQEVQNILDEGNLEMGSINEGLEEMAGDLKQSEKMEAAANAMMNKDLMEAAERFRKMAQEMNMTTNPPEINNQMQQSLEQASENSRPGLENLSQDMKEAAENLKKQDEQGAKQSLGRAANDLQDLARKMQSQQLKNEASRKLENLEQSLNRRQQRQQQEQQATPGQSQEQQQGQPQQKAASNGEQGQQAQPPGQPGEAGPDQSEATGQDPSGSQSGNPAGQGPPTQLDVQLQREKLTGQHGEGDGKQKQEMIEEASRAERSKLDYRNVTSELSSAQQDLLNQDYIPWQYRYLIKNYFQAIRPRGKNDK